MAQENCDTLIESFPPPIVDQFSQIFFYHILHCLVHQNVEQLMLKNKYAKSNLKYLKRTLSY